MTRDVIEDYLYFFWAPLLKAAVLNADDNDEFQKMIILTFSQANIYIDAPEYEPGSDRNFSQPIQDEISALADKIVANIPARTAEDNYWCKITISKLLPASVGFSDTHLEAEKSFGPFGIDADRFISFDFFYLPYQLLIQLPMTPDVSAVLSSKKKFDIADGPVLDISLVDCSLWLSATHADTNVNDQTQYFGLRLPGVNLLFDEGFTKNGNRISADLFHMNAGVVITCLAGSAPPALPAFPSIVAGNAVQYPEKFVFTLAPVAPLLPVKPRIALSHAEPFVCNFFGSAVTTVATDNIAGSWVSDKRLLSYPLPVTDDGFTAGGNDSPVFALSGAGKIQNSCWYFATVSVNHPLANGRLGISAECGYFGFEIKDKATISWQGLDNGPLQISGYALRSSPDSLFINYTALPSVLAIQELSLWKGKKNSYSAIHITYPAGGAGNLISRRAGIDQHVTSASLRLDIDRPVLSNGDRVFMKTDAGLLMVRENNTLSVALVGEKMNPAMAFESSAYKRFSSIVLANAMIIVNPVEMLVLVAYLNETGNVLSGQCDLQFPVYYIEHTLPDPYISNLFNDQPVDNADGQPTKTLKAKVVWTDAENVILDIKLADAKGNIFIPRPSLTDEQMAERLLHFPLPHPGENTYDDTLKNYVQSPGRIDTVITTDSTPYGNYKSQYHSATNSTGAYSTLHILPGNTSLVDVSGRASQMGVAFSRSLNNTENGIEAVLANTGYTTQQTYRIEQNQLVSSGRFVRAFTLPHVQWEPVFFEDKNDFGIFYNEENPFPTHGVPTRLSSANKADVTLAPVAVSSFIVDSFQDENGKYAAAAHFALPFGMNAVTLFHPMVDDVVAPPPDPLGAALFIRPDPYSYSLLHFNQPDFTVKKTMLEGAIQIKAISEGYPKVSRDNMPDPSFHGAVLQMPEGFSTVIDNRLNQVISGAGTAAMLLPGYISGVETPGFVLLNNLNNSGAAPLIQYADDSILGIPFTRQFNRQMWGEQDIQQIQVDKTNRKATVTFRFRRSANAKVPLRRIDFSGFGASVFSNWLNKTATAGAVSQVKFNILIGRVAHEVIQIKSVIIPWFIPVVRTLIIERKNHGNIIRTDSGWVATGPGIFHNGYSFHPGVVRGVYNVSSIKDTGTVTQQAVNGGIADMSGVYFDADALIENVVSGFKNVVPAPAGNYKYVASKKQFGYIILGNPNDGVTLENYFTPDSFRKFMLRPDIGALGGPVDCVISIAGSDQLMHLTRIDVTATASTLFVAAARGTLHFPKGGSWSVVRKVTGGATTPLNNTDTVPLIRNGLLTFTPGGDQLNVLYNNSLHVLGNVAEIEKYATGLVALATVEYALLQSTDTQKLLFPRPSFDSLGDAMIVNGITEGAKKIYVTNPVVADPYSILKSNTIFPDGADVLTLGNVTGLVKNLDIIKATSGISFPPEVAGLLQDFTPAEYVASNRTLYLVNQGSFQIYIDYGDGSDEKPKQTFSVGLDGNADDHAGGADPKKWEMLNKNVAIVVNIDVFKPLLIVKGNFSASAGAVPSFDDATIEWGGQPALQKIVEVLTILYQLSTAGGGDDIVKKGFSFAMSNSPDSWSYKCSIEEKIPVLKFPSPVQLSQLPGPAPLIVEAGLNVGVFFNLSLSTDPDNLIKAGAGIALGFEATIQVLLLSLEVASVYGVGSARVDIYIELPDAKPTFKFTMGFGATVAVQLPVVGYVSITRVMSLGASIDSNGMEMTAGQMLRGVITVAGGLASVSIQVEASGTVTDKKGERAAIVRGVFTLDVTVAWVLSWDFSKEFQHTIDLPNPF